MTIYIYSLLRVGGYTLLFLHSFSWGCEDDLHECTLTVLPASAAARWYRLSSFAYLYSPDFCFGHHHDEYQFAESVPAFEICWGNIPLNHMTGYHVPDTVPPLRHHHHPGMVTPNTQPHSHPQMQYPVRTFSTR